MMSDEREETQISRRMWAAMMLARDVDTFEALLRLEPVPIRRLAPTPLRRALRGGPPPRGEWITISLEMLDAVALAGAFGR